MAFAPGWPGTDTPYSVSMPITRRTLMAHTLVPGRGRPRSGARRPVCVAPSGRAAAQPTSALRVAPSGRAAACALQPAQSQVLAGVRHGVDRPAGLVTALA